MLNEDNGGFLKLINLCLLFQGIQSMVSSKNIFHEFSKTGDILLEIFQQQAMFIAVKSTVYIWTKQKLLGGTETTKYHRNHKVLSGHWCTIDLGEKYGNHIIPLGIKYNEDQKTSAYWSLLFLSKSKNNYQVHHQIFQHHQFSNDWKKNLKKTNIVVEFTTPNELENFVCVYSSCGRTCILSLHILNESSRLYLIRLNGSNIQVQDLCNEVKFLSKEESIKCIEFLFQGT